MSSGLTIQETDMYLECPVIGKWAEQSGSEGLLPDTLSLFLRQYGASDTHKAYHSPVRSNIP